MSIERDKLLESVNVGVRLATGPGGPHNSLSTSFRAGSGGLLRPLLRGREKDVLRAANTLRRERPRALLPATGSRVVNSRGVPGSVGFLAVTRHDHQLVLVTAHHVLFGDGAREGEPVWGASDSAGTPLVPIGKTLYGRSGSVRGDSRGVYVDCGVASLRSDTEIGHAASIKCVLDTEHSLAAGDRVTKIGAATGFTEGEVVSTDYRSAAVRHGRTDAVGQILIRSSLAGQPFSAPGDSGAAVVGEQGKIVALLWGEAASGNSLACPIAPVLYVLNIVPARSAPNANRDLGASEAR